MEFRVEVGKYSIYRCPSCENFFVIDDWSEENDICKPCLDGIEYVEETDDGYSI